MVDHRTVILTNFKLEEPQWRTRLVPADPKIRGAIHSHYIEEVRIKALGHTTNTRPSYGRNHPKWS